LLQFCPPVPKAFLGVPLDTMVRSKINAQFCDESAYAHRQCCESVARAPCEELSVLEEAKLCFFAQLSADHRHGKNFGEVNFQTRPVISAVSVSSFIIYTDEVGAVQEIAENLVPDLAGQAKETGGAAVEVGAALKSGSNTISQSSISTYMDSIV
jgi:hypothetical protein